MGKVQENANQSGMFHQPCIYEVFLKNFLSQFIQKTMRLKQTRTSIEPLPRHNALSYFLNEYLYRKWYIIWSIIIFLSVHSSLDSKFRIGGGFVSLVQELDTNLQFWTTSCQFGEYSATESSVTQSMFCCSFAQDYLWSEVSYSWCMSHTRLIFRLDLNLISGSLTNLEEICR